MPLEVPTREWMGSNPDLHLDPKMQPQEDPAKLAEQVRRHEIVRQIGETELEDLDGVLDRLSEALLRKPELGNDPDYIAKLDAAQKRLQELMRGPLH